MLDFGFYNMDCMEGMKQFPDNYFELAIVDPPYGAGFTEGGGCKGWFSKYHQNAETHEILGGGVENLNTGTDLVEGLINTSIKAMRTGGTWAQKYGKKSYRGTQPLEKNILKNFSVSHEIRLYGAAIIFRFRRQDALLFGENLLFQTVFQWQWQNMRGLLSTKMRKCLSAHRKTQREQGFTLVYQKANWFSSMANGRKSKK